MTTSINTATKTPSNISGSDVHDAAPTHDAKGIKDNLSESRGVVIKSNEEKPKNTSLTLNEAPELASPDSFKNEKPFNVFALQADNAILNLGIKKQNLEITQHNLEMIKSDQKKNNEDFNKKVNEQADKQAKSASKSGFMGVFNKVFAGLQIIAGIAAMFVPGLQVFGALMILGGAISLASSNPALMEKFSGAITSVLEKCGMSADKAKEWGGYLASGITIVAQIACAIGSFNALGAVSAGASAMRLLGTGLKTFTSATGVAQGAVDGGVGIAKGINDADLAKITKAVDILQSNSDFLNQHMNLFMNSIQQTYKEMSATMSSAVQGMDSVPTFQVA